VGHQGEDELAGLVAATRGIQPWRRVLHASLGCVVARYVGWIAPDHTTAAIVVSAVAAAALMLDLIRFTVPAVNRLFFRYLRVFASPREAEGIASSTWYMIGVALVVALFPAPHAIAGILVLALADPTASYVGQRWGKHKLGTGSVEGTLVFVIVASIILLRAWPWPDALLTVAVVTVVERAPWRFDDNITVPLTVASMLWALALI
jgi:dolichol kinase